MKRKIFSFTALMVILSMVFTPVSAHSSLSINPDTILEVFEEIKSYSPFSVSLAEDNANHSILSSTVLLSEGFEGAVFPPLGWARYNMEGNDQWERSTFNKKSGTYSASHDSFMDLYQEGWLVTPPLNIVDNTIISFYDSTWSIEDEYYHGLMLSTGSCDPNDGEFVELAAFDAIWAWTERAYDLSAYTGAQVCIAFLFEGKYDEWFIDDVLVIYYEDPEYGLSLSPEEDSQWGEPGETVVYDLTLTNTGNVTDTYEVTFSGSTWTVVLPTDSFTLAPGMNDSVAVQVTVPVGAGNEFDTVIVTAASETDSDVSASTALTTRAFVFGVELTTDQNIWWGKPLETVVYTLELTNTGKINDTFALTISGNNWSVHLPETSVTLAPDGSQEVSVQVNIPISADEGDSDMVTVEAASGANPDVTSIVTLSTTAYIGQVLLSEGFEGEAFPPPGWASFDMDGGGTEWVRSDRSKHSGSYSAYHEFSFPDPHGKQEGWLVTPPLSIVDNTILRFYDSTWYVEDYQYHGLMLSTGSCDPADGDFVELAVLDPIWEWTERIFDLSVYAGEEVCIAFLYDGEYADDWFVDDVLVIFYVEPEYGLSLTAVETSKTGLPGDTVVYSLTLTNTGNTSDIFTLSYIDAVWQVTLSHTEAALLPGASIQLTAQVLIPPGAQAGETDSFNVRAVSQTDESVSGQVTLTNTMGAITPDIFTIYLPLILKP
jgi:hypothetical protein